MPEQENPAKTVFHAKLLGLVGALGASKWHWEDLAMKTRPRCSPHVLFFFFFTPSFRNCPGNDTRDKPGHGDVLGNVALERYGDHGKGGFCGGVGARDLPVPGQSLLKAELNPSAWLGCGWVLSRRMMKYFVSRFLLSRKPTP